jgi:hypothetical protein
MAGERCEVVLRYRARIVRRGESEHCFESSGSMTPYELQSLEQEVVRTGSGARLEITLEAAASEQQMGEIERALARLGRREVALRLCRERAP